MSARDTSRAAWGRPTGGTPSIGVCEGPAGSVRTLRNAACLRAKGGSDGPRDENSGGRESRGWVVHLTASTPVADFARRPGVPAARGEPVAFALRTVSL